MFKSIGVALGQPTSNPDRHPVRRHSRMAGRCEGAFWCRTDRRQVQRIVQAAEKYDRAGRQRGRRNGPLGHVALELLKLLANVVDFRSGRLEPCVAFIMGKLRRSKSAIYDALNALRAHGFVDWMRRYEPTGLEGRGPRIKQTSNAYKMLMPPCALRLLGVKGQDVPLPDDFAQELEARRRELEAQKAGLPLDELAILEVEDERLGHLIAQMGRHVQERESAGRTEYQTKVFP